MSLLERIEFGELQPAAYPPPISTTFKKKKEQEKVDGGATEISVELVAGQDLTKQNFRELGLRPEFIYNRLFTTLVMPIGSANWTAAITQINTDAENGVVNAQIVTTSNAPQVEGEALPSVNSQVAAVPVQMSKVMAEGEGSTDEVVSAKCRPQRVSPMFQRSAPFRTHLRSST